MAGRCLDSTYPNKGENSGGVTRTCTAQTQHAPFAPLAWQQRRRHGRRSLLAQSARRRQGHRGRRAPLAPSARTARSSSRSLGAGAMGTAYPGALPPLWRRSGDGYCVVWEKGRETKKGKLDGEGMEKKRRDNMKAATGCTSNRCSLVRCGAVFMTSVQYYDRSRVHSRRACNDKWGDSNI